MTEYRYDDLGRITRILSPDGVAEYNWDTAPKGIGKPVNSRSTDGVGISYRYDSIGRPATTTWNIESAAYEFVYGYDGIGRLGSVTYPAVPVPGQSASRFKLIRTYRANGDLETIKDAAVPNGSPIWAAEEKNAASQLTQERYANGVSTGYSYEPDTGLLSTVLRSCTKANPSRSAAVQLQPGSQRRGTHRWHQRPCRVVLV